LTVLLDRAGPAPCLGYVVKLNTEPKKVETKNKAMKTYRFLVCKRVYAEVQVEAETKDDATEAVISMKDWQIDWEGLDEATMTIEDSQEVLDDEE
jgi:hypothetical protein